MRMIHDASIVRADGPSRARRKAWAGCAVLLAVAGVGPAALASEGHAGEQFAELILPILEDNCYACHGYGITKGNVDLERLAEDWGRPEGREVWLAVLKNVRAGIMPPAGEPEPSDEERARLEDWIKFGAFGIDPERPDPGRVTVRRLNRTEYRNTIRDLIGIDYDADDEFPPDDTGHGFDTIADVLTISPLLMEKYIAAAQDVIARAVPTTSGAVPERTIGGRRFRSADAEDDADRGRGDAPPGRRSRQGGDSGRGEGPLSLSFYEPASVSTAVEAEHEGRYELDLNLVSSERYVDGVFDYNKCRLVFRIDGEEVLREEFTRQGGRSYRFEFDRDWRAGTHDLAIELEPLTPDAEQGRSLTLRIDSVTLRGPIGEEHLVRPPDYDRFFPGDVPDDPAGRRRYAREILSAFATRAFRRPVGDETADRLTDLAEAISSQDGATFEAGIAQAMVAVLASPRFLFREEGVQEGSSGPYPPIDEYALATRLSYFLWSTMPDEELTRLASEGKLREDLAAQVARMLDDPRSGEFIRHFVGQWLQVRDVDSVPINAFAVMSRDAPPDPEGDRRRERFRELRRKPSEQLTDAEKAELEEIRGEFGRSFGRFREFELDRPLRQAMRRETEMLFEHIIRGDRGLVELLDSDYTFLNERLARHYGIEGVEGDEMRRVDLPPDSPRGGVLTQGTVLAVTSNPDRTSPVKRGLFILDNILGTPPAPPPPDIPSLEEAGNDLGGRVPTLREALELHRDSPMCASCHNRMDPLGLALENFNALGLYRERERSGPIDASGVLITGESFTKVQELKRILAEDRRRDFDRCLSEKMLTYALGRGLEYHDVQAVDLLVDRLEAGGGRASDLILGVVESAPFQRRRGPAGLEAAGDPDPGDRIGDD